MKKLGSIPQERSLKNVSRIACAVAAALGLGASARSVWAADIYTETWSTGSISAAYNATSTSTNGIASVVSGELTLSNGASPAATGHVRVTQDVTTSGLYDTDSYSTTLDANGDGNILTWDFNMMNNRNNPSGFGSGNYGSAYVLAASNPDFLGAGEGYAVVIGSTGADPVSLIHYTAGMLPIGTGSKSLPYNVIGGTTDANQRYQSIRVTYSPGTDKWRLYLRDDGASAFTDAIATPVPAESFIGEATLAATSTALNYSGYLWNHAGGSSSGSFNQTARFDNINLTLNPAISSRNLWWDADATGDPTDGGGAWATANTWINLADFTHTTWDGSAPDNAIFGAYSGAGSASVDLGAGQVVGGISFNPASPNYTLTGGTLHLVGDSSNDGIVANNPAVIDTSSIRVHASQDWHVNGSNTLTVNAPLSGPGQVEKWGTGTVELDSASPSFSGGWLIQTGAVRVTSAANGISGLGSGQVEVKSDATLHLDATGAPISIQSGSGQLFMGDDSTLNVTGAGTLAAPSVTWQKNYPRFSNGSITNPADITITADAGAVLLWRAQLRNFSAAQSYATIHLNGPGIVKITNSASDAGNNSDAYGGDWDLSAGTLILGQNSETDGSSGNTLNALGMKDGDAAIANTATVRGGALLIGTENTPNPAGPVNWYRANLSMAGGTLASGNGKDTAWGGHFVTNTGTTSTVATYDPLNPDVSRNVSLVHGAPDQGGTWAQGDTTWNGNLIVDAGSTTGGKFIINRDGGTVSVSAGATITVNPGATLELDGTLDALSDGTNHLNVLNNSTATLHVKSATINVAAVTGAGSTVVDSSATLIANHIQQSALTAAGAVLIRPNGSNTSKLSALAIPAGGKLDLNDNDLIVDGGDYGAIEAAVIQGYNNGSWTGAGITSSTAAGNASLLALGVADNDDLNNTEFSGQTGLDGDEILVKFTYVGDANLTGGVNLDDFNQFLFGFNPANAAPQIWLNGDFNYTGSVNLDDFNLFLFGLANQGGALVSPELFAALTDFVRAESIDTDLSSVPEPSAIGVLALSGLLVIRRRRTRMATGCK